MNAELIGILIYILIQLLFGIWISKKINTEADYFIGGRQMGAVITIFTVFATWFGAETCMGTAGRVFESGLSGAHVDPFGYTTCLLFMGLFFASKLWDEKLTTVADLFKKKFSPTTEKIAVFIVAPSSLIWSAAQLRAFGQIVSATAGINIELGIALATVVVLLYTCTGGFLADAYTDLVQGIALIIGLIILLVVVFSNLGGVTTAVSNIPTQKFTFFVTSNSYWEELEVFLIPIIGSLTAQELVSRVVASKNGGIAKKSTIIASGLYLIVGLIPVAIGLLAPQIISQIDHPEQIMPVLARQQLPFILFILFIGALISAILSTVDSTLLAVSSLITHNLVFGHFERKGKTLTETKKVFYARVGVVTSGIVAFLICFTADSIFELVEAASAFGGTGMFVVFLAAIYGKQHSIKAANTTLILGIISTPLFEYVFNIPNPFTWSLVLVFVVFIGMTYFTEKRIIHT
jgi:SSS family transporter